jgi:glucose-1-phosphate thymidylyltransferase
MKGIVLAGGLGTRLAPITNITSKQLLLIYDKPLIFYPISTLMLAGIREIQIVCKSKDIDNFKILLGHGMELGIELSYQVQDSPKGLPDGIIKSRDFIGSKNFAFILGDNFFYGAGLGTGLKNIDFKSGAQIFTFGVKDPENFGVIELNDQKEIVSLEEKPVDPKSNRAVTGLYFFSSDAVEKANSLKMSKRNEIEMIDLLNIYLQEGTLKHREIPRGTVWLDTGSFDAILETSNFVRIIERRQNQQIANLEEIAWRQGWINDDELLRIARCASSPINREYLQDLVLDKK